jgi:hypothetical protein
VKLLFVGERKSRTAEKRGWSWTDGRLAAKQLFDALVAIAIDPAACRFANAFERGALTAIRQLQAEGYTVVAMGAKAQERLAHAGIAYRPMVHPAARGRIRLKARYAEHVRSVIGASGR